MAMIFLVCGSDWISREKGKNGRWREREEEGEAETVESGDSKVQKGLEEEGNEPIYAHSQAVSVRSSRVN